MRTRPQVVGASVSGRELTFVAGTRCHAPHISPSPVTSAPGRSSAAPQRGRHRRVRRRDRGVGCRVPRRRRAPPSPERRIRNKRRVPRPQEPAPCAPCTGTTVAPRSCGSTRERRTVAGQGVGRDRAPGRQRRRVHVRRHDRRRPGHPTPPPHVPNAGNNLVEVDVPQAAAAGSMRLRAAGLRRSRQRHRKGGGVRIWRRRAPPSAAVRR